MRIFFPIINHKMTCLPLAAVIMGSLLAPVGVSANPAKCGEQGIANASQCTPLSTSPISLTPIAPSEQAADTENVVTITTATNQQGSELGALNPAAGEMLNDSPEAAANAYLAKIGLLTPPKN